MTAELISDVTVVALLAVAAVADLATRRIPNWLTVTGWVVAMLSAFVVGGWDGALAGLLGTLVGLALTLPGFAIGFTGAGDVKLFGMLGAFVGGSDVAWTFAATVLIGASLVVLAAAWRRLRGVGAGADSLARYNGMLYSGIATRSLNYVAPEAGSTMAMRLPLAPIALVATLVVMAMR